MSAPNQCSRDCRYQHLYAGSQASLSDMAGRQAAALIRVGRLKAGIVSSLKQTFPMQFADAETKLGRRISALDDEHLLAYLNGFLNMPKADSAALAGRSAPSVNLSALRTSLVAAGIPLPYNDDPDTWAAAVSGWAARQVPGQIQTAVVAGSGPVVSVSEARMDDMSVVIDDHDLSHLPPPDSEPVDFDEFGDLSQYGVSIDLEAELPEPPTQNSDMSEWEALLGGATKPAELDLPTNHPASVTMAGLAQALAPAEPAEPGEPAEPAEPRRRRPRRRPAASAAPEAPTDQSPVGPDSHTAPAPEAPRLDETEEIELDEAQPYSLFEGLGALVEQHTPAPSPDPVGPVSEPDHSIPVTTRTAGPIKPTPMAPAAPSGWRGSAQKKPPARTRKVARVSAAGPGGGADPAAQVTAAAQGGELTDELREKLQAVVCTPRPVFTSDLVEMTGSPELVAAWEKEQFSLGSSGQLRFIGPKARHKARGALVIPHQKELREALPGFTGSYWAQATGDPNLKAARIYELGVVLHRFIDNVVTFNIGTRVVDMRINQSRGLVGLVLVLDSEINEPAVRAELGERMVDLGNGRLSLMAVCTYAGGDRARVQLAQAVNEELTNRGIQVAFPIIAEHSWVFAENGGTTALAVV